MSAPDQKAIQKATSTPPGERAIQLSDHPTTGAAIRTRPSAWARLASNKKAQIGGVLLLLIVASALATPLLTSYEPDQQDLRAKLTPPVWQAGGTWDHPLGTDHLGRDVLSRILYGSRISLTVGFLATAAAAVIGIGLGTLSGYFGRYIDAIVMRLVDVQMAFPSILLALAVTVMLGANFRNLILVLAITSWVLFSRVIRAEVLSIRNRDFVEAGRAIGATDTHLVRRYIAPNLVGTVTVIATLTIARVIISEASLSFLGVGIQPPTPSWGGMLSEGRGYLSVAWWIATLPGIALMMTVIAVNLLGDALRDVLDPRLSGDGN